MCVCVFVCACVCACVSWHVMACLTVVCFLKRRSFEVIRGTLLN